MSTDNVKLSPNVFVYKINDSFFVRSDENIYEIKDIKNDKKLTSFFEVLDKGLNIDKFTENITGEEKNDFLKLYNFLNEKRLFIKNDALINNDFVSYKKYYSDSDILNKNIELLKQAKINIVAKNDKFKKHLLRCLEDNGFNLSEIGSKKDGGFAVFIKDYKTDESKLEEFNQLNFKNKTPWLLVDLSIGNYISVGPLVIPEKTACYKCYLERRVINDDTLTIHALMSRQSLKSGNVHYLPLQYDFVASIVADNILRFFMQLPTLTQSCIIYADLQKFEIWKEYLLKYPKCPVCNGLF